MGSNIYQMVGDGLGESVSAPKGLIDLKNRVVLQVSCGNFHVIALVSS
jgi:hypothetical protein